MVLVKGYLQLLLTFFDLFALVGVQMGQQALVEIDQSGTVLADGLVPGGGDGDGSLADLLDNGSLLGGGQRKLAGQALDGGLRPAQLRVGRTRGGIEAQAGGAFSDEEADAVAAKQNGDQSGGDHEVVAR